MNNRIINDIVVLGRASPDRDKDGKIIICLAGYSISEKQFIRLYPITPQFKVSRWDIIQADVELNKLDRRFESWKLRGNYDEIHLRYRKLSRLNRQKRLDFLDTIKDSCVSKINENKRSLGIIKTKSIKGEYKRNINHGGLFQPPLTGNNFVIKKDFPYRPYLQYICDGENCNGHDQQLLEWGIFEFLRKYPERFESIWDNLQIYNREYDHYLLVGNQWAQRSKFMVISDLRLKNPIKKQLSLFGIDNGS